jgi:hypothetical protein
MYDSLQPPQELRLYLERLQEWLQKDRSAARDAAGAVPQT